MALDKQNDRPKLLIEVMLYKYFLQLPEIIRVFVYLVMLALFVFITVNTIVGNYVLTGRVFTQFSTDSRPSYGVYCIKIGDRTYGSNREGEFHAVVPISDYIVSKAAGIEARVSSMDNPKPSSPIDLKAKIFSNEFKSDIYMDENGLATFTSQNKEIGSFNFLKLINTAHAGGNLNATTDKSNRLFIKEIATSEDWSSKSINMSIKSNHGLIALNNIYSSSGKTYSLPVIPGKTINTNQEYFFKLPVNNQINTKFVLKGLGGMLFYNSPTHLVVVNNKFKVGELTELKFSDDIQVLTKLYTAYDVIYFATADEDKTLVKKIITKLDSLGIRPISVPSLTGKIPNAIFSNKDIPFDVTQKVIQTAFENGVLLKTIQCGKLKTSADNQIQIGYSGKYNFKNNLNDADLKKFLDAESQNEFNSYCDSA